MIVHFLFFIEKWIKYDAKHNFFLLMRTGYNQLVSDAYEKNLSLVCPSWILLFYLMSKTKYIHMSIAKT